MSILRFLGCWLLSVGNTTQNMDLIQI
jgi:hypothetical protein